MSAARELRLHLSPSLLSFVDVLTPPSDAPASFAWLNRVDDLTLIARATNLKGVFSNQNASVKVGLSNQGKQAAALLGRPLRVVAEIFVRGVLYFSGRVQAVEYGTDLILTVEA